MQTHKKVVHKRQFCLARRALYLFSFSCSFSFSSAFALSFSFLKKKKRGVWGERRKQQRERGAAACRERGALHPFMCSAAAGRVIVSAPLCSSIALHPERGQCEAARACLTLTTQQKKRGCAALLSHFIKYCEEIRLLPLPAAAKHNRGWSAPRSGCSIIL